MKRLIEILIMVAIWSVAGYAGYMMGSKEKAEPNKSTYQAIYNRALSAEEIAEIDQKLSEPNEPEDVTYTDPNSAYFTTDYAIDFLSKSETISVNDTDIYLKNIHLLDKDELRDFALFINCASVPLYVCDEYYEGILNLVPEKLLKKPD